MRYIGVDFTSSPSRRKPIVTATLDTSEVRFTTLESPTEFREWFLVQDGLLGIDAPFGYPVELCQEVFGRTVWSTVAEQLATIKLHDRHDGLEAQVKDFRDRRPEGKKEPRRLTDIEAKAFSAMKFGRPPVGRMAARLIPILHESSFNIAPVRMNASPVTVVEVYPGRYVKDTFGAVVYKGEKSSATTRKQILESTGISVSESDRALILEDEEADYLDALIAVRQLKDWHEKGRWLPLSDQVRLEGWII